MTEPTRGTRYRSLNDVICFDRIPLANENANRLERENQANLPSSNHADEPIAPPHCVPPTVKEATPSAGPLTEMIAEKSETYGFSAARSLRGVVAPVHS